METANSPKILSREAAGRDLELVRFRTRFADEEWFLVDPSADVAGADWCLMQGTREACLEAAARS